ncbi:MAG: TAXI family TRAP transporter solute-binding subunit [Pseudomonadota bacterium]
MKVVLGALVALLALAAIVVLGRDLPPPRTVIFAAGGEGGGYWRIAERYRFLLSRDGIEVTLLETGGSVDNARLLADGEAQVALLQGGVEPIEGDDVPRIEALGAVFLEPLLIFARADAPPPGNPALWEGLRIAAGGEGSGTRAAWRAFERAAGLSAAANALVPLGGEDAAQALLAGEADLVFYVAPLEAPYLRTLHDSDLAETLALEHAAAISRRLDQSRVLTLPAGAVSLDPVIPAEDAPLLAMVARLAAAEGLHPALVNRLVLAARRIHGRRSVISDEGDFPSVEHASLPVGDQARELIETGPSPLARFLPWWIAAQLNRVLLLVVPVAVLVIPLMRAAPAIYAWRMRSRVYRHYDTILELDAEAAGTRAADRLQEIYDRLRKIDLQIAALKLPLTYREYAYTARLHVDLVRKRVARRLQRALDAAAGGAGFGEGSHEDDRERDGETADAAEDARADAAGDVGAGPPLR